MSNIFFDLFNTSPMNISANSTTSPSKKTPTRTKSDPKVYKSYMFVDLNTFNTTEWSHMPWEGILERQNGKVSEYSHKGSYTPYKGTTVYYNKGDRLECTLEWNLNNANMSHLNGHSSFKLKKGITLETLAKEANISVGVLELLILCVDRYKDTPIYDLVTGVIQ